MTRQASPTRRAWAAAVALLLALVFVLVVVGRQPSEPQPAAAAKTPVAAPTESAAVEAAVSYAMSLRWDVLVDDERRQEVVARHAAAGAADELDADLAVNVEPVRAAVSVPPVVARRAVLGTRVDRFEPPSASVSLWGLAIFATGAYGPVTQWSTSRLHLVWQESRWRVAAVTSRGGPSPESSLVALARADAAFKEVRSAP